MSELKQSPLSSLKYPLVFFGMALFIVESAFSFALKGSTSEKTSFILSSWMGGLFLIAILVVAFLVYKVPTHIMLESQKELKEDLDRELDSNYKKLEDKLLELSMEVEILKTMNNKKDKRFIEEALKIITSTYRRK